MATDRSVIQQVYTQAELDAAAREAAYLAYARAGLVLLGDHLREQGGHCQPCGTQHSPPEWARIEAEVLEAGIPEGVGISGD